MSNPEYRNVKGHIEVYENGEFIFSEDTKTEATKEYNRGYCHRSGKYCSHENCEACNLAQSDLTRG